MRSKQTDNPLAEFPPELVFDGLIKKLKKEGYDPDEWLINSLQKLRGNAFSKEERDFWTENPDRLRFTFRFIYKNASKTRIGIDARGKVFTYWEGLQMPRRIVYPVTI